MYHLYCYELSIVAKLTDHASLPRQQPLAADAEASLRQTLAGQLAGAQAKLSANLIELRRGSGADAGLIAQGDAQLGALLALKSQLDHASPAALAMIRSDIAACVAAAATTSQQAQAVTAAATGTASLTAASEAARAEVASVDDDLFKRRIFDPYLRFGSKADEDAYRRREEQRETQIKAAQSENTPQGTLRAANLTIDQIDDAGAHGASRSPEFAAHRKAVVDVKEGLETALRTEAAPAELAQSGVPAPAAATVDPDKVSAKSGLQDAIASLRAAGVAPVHPDTAAPVVQDASGPSTMRLG